MLTVTGHNVPSQIVPGRNQAVPGKTKTSPGPGGSVRPKRPASTLNFRIGDLPLKKFQVRVKNQSNL